jgi:hypothetical protein
VPLRLPEQRQRVVEPTLCAQRLREQDPQADDALTLLREAERHRDGSLVFPRRQAMAHLAGALLDAGRPGEALATAHDAMAVPAEDVRSRVVALRVLAGCLAACGDVPAAELALRQAVALAGATQQSSERSATERALAGLVAR